MPGQPPADAALNAARRASDLAALSSGEVVDVLVIGGGATGAGVALDAATRGLSVALLERGDLATGTSGWSSKLVHGGLRYLSSLDLPIAWESALERGRLMSRIAPHLVRPMPMVVPLHRGVGRRDAALIGAAFRAGDALRVAARTPASLLPRPGRVSAELVLRLAPAAMTEGLRGGLLSWDGQLVDDARLVLTIARTATAHGARIITYAKATAVRPNQVDVVDRLSGERHTLRARQVVNAAGVWADALSERVELAPSKGSHLLVRAARLGHPTAAVTAPVPGHLGRFVFAVPWPDGLVMIGLTDDPHTGVVPARARPGEDEQTFLLETISRALQEPLTDADVVGSYAGFRPLLKGNGSSSADLSRKHALVRDADTGLLTVVGGKLTTYRRMAQEAVDAAVQAGDLRAGPCRTARLPLIGAGQPPAGLTDRLVRRYGTDATTVTAYGNADPSQNEPLRSGIPLSGAEVRFAIEHELAVTVADVVDRRTRWGLVDADRDDLMAAVRAHAPELLDADPQEG